MAAAALEELLEIAEEFRHAIAPEIPRAALGRRDLLLEIEPARHRMMRVVDFHHQVGDGELQLMRPQPPGLVLRREAEPRPEIEQDVRGLRDDVLAGFQDRRRERRMLFALALHEGDVRLAAALARDVDIVGAGLLQREADEFAAPLDGRPVIEFVAHGFASRLGNSVIPRYAHAASATLPRDLTQSPCDAHKRLDSIRSLGRPPWSAPSPPPSLLTLACAVPLQQAAAQDAIGGAIFGGAAGAILGGAIGGRGGAVAGAHHRRHHRRGDRGRRTAPPRRVLLVSQRLLHAAPGRRLCGGRAGNTAAAPVAAPPPRPTDRRSRPVRWPDGGTKTTRSR